ncbi:MAG: WG repeat-containing protein [Prevotellaceae bacterium]|jgi:hypothetical protein|nr:WG repeat-containing protein [Prevotellaceae bacterium]
MKRVNLFLVSMVMAVTLSFCFSSCGGGSREKLSQALAKYDKYESFSEGLAAVVKNGKYGYINKSGKEAVPCVYTGGSSFSEGLAAVVKDGKYGYINKSGKELIPCVYTGAGNFSNGFAEVKHGEKIGIIDRKGKEICPGYDKVYLLERLYYTTSLDGNIAVIDEQGKIIPLNGYNYIKKIKNTNDLILVGVEQSQDEVLWGFMDMATKKEIIPCIYEIPDHFISDYYCFVSEGLIFSVGKNSKYGLIDKTGKQLTPFKYRYIGDLSEERALVWTETGAGYIDKTGREIIPCMYEDASPFSEGLACVQKHDKKCGFIDKNGETVIPFIYNVADDKTDEMRTETCFKNGLAVLSINDRKASIYDRDYDSAYGDYMIKGPYGVIDKTGKIIIPFIYRNIRLQGNNLNNLFVCYDSNNKKYGILDRTGKEIVPFDCYSDIEQTADNYIVTLNEKKGLLDSTGKKIIPCEFENIYSSDFSDGLMRCTRNGMEGYIDMEGYFIGKGTVEKIEKN